MKMSMRRLLGKAVYIAYFCWKKILNNSEAKHREPETKMPRNRKAFKVEWLPFFDENVRKTGVIH